jgi:hypothetical protein
MRDKLKTEKAPQRAGLNLGMPSVEKLLGLIVDRDARLGLTILVLVLMLLLFAWLVQTYRSVSQFDWELVRVLFLFVAVAVGLVVFFKAIDGSAIPKVILWYLTSMLILTATAFWIQTILRSPVSFLIEPSCFVHPWNQGCPFGSNASGKPEDAADVIKKTNDSANPAQNEPSGNIAPLQYRPESRNSVAVKFAGALSREDVVKVSLALQKAGWKVEGADRGGERTARAIGVNQVRYFHDDDKIMAAQLANQYNGLAKWVGFRPLSILFVPDNPSSLPVGWLQVWTNAE